MLSVSRAMTFENEVSKLYVSPLNFVLTVLC